MTLVGTAAAWPLQARGQQTNRMVRIGVLMGSLATGPTRASLTAFIKRLEELGWWEGGNADIEVRWWDGNPKTMRSGAEELLAFSPHVIMVFTNLALSAIMPILGKVPVVFVASDFWFDVDPVPTGSDVRESARTPEQIRAAVERLLSETPAEAERRRHRAEELIADAFA